MQSNHRSGHAPRSSDRCHGPAPSASFLDLLGHQLDRSYGIIAREFINTLSVRSIGEVLHAHIVVPAIDDSGFSPLSHWGFGFISSTCSIVPITGGRVSAANESKPEIPGVGHYVLYPLLLRMKEVLSLYS